MNAEWSLIVKETEMRNKVDALNKVIVDYFVIILCLEVIMAIQVLFKAEVCGSLIIMVISLLLCAQPNRTCK